MKDSPFDVVICVGPQDTHLAASSIRSLKIFTALRKVFVVTSVKNFSIFQQESLKDIAIELVDEDVLIAGVTLQQLKDYINNRVATTRKAGWYLQQFLKMAMCHHPEISQHYLVWDGDTLMLQPITFFTDSGKVLIKPSVEFHRPYFTAIEKVLGFSRQVNFSFISEHLMVNKDYMKELIEEISSRSIGDRSWVYTILDSIDDKNLPRSGFSEYETYGNFVHLKHPDSYECRPVKSSRLGLRYAGKNPKPFDLYSLSKQFLYVTFESHHRYSKKLPLFKLRSMLIYLFDSITHADKVRAWHQQWGNKHSQYG